jgi:hypothetical protein
MAQSIFTNNELRVDPRNGAPAFVRGEFALSELNVAALQPADQVKEFLKTHAADLQLNAPGSDFQLISNVAATPKRHVLRYQQNINGIPVMDGVVVVHVGQDNVVKQVSVQQPGVNQAPPATPKLTKDDAMQAALKNENQPALRMAALGPDLVYFPEAHGKGVRLAYKIVLPTAKPAHDWQIVLDANTAEVLQRQDLIQEVDGAGKVFYPNPVKSSMNNALRSPKATAGPCGFSGSTAATINAQQVTKPLKDITLSGGTYHLEGPYCKIVDLAPPTIAPPTEAVATNFNYGVGDNRLEPVNVYFHVDNIQRYIQSLGITNANNRQQPCDAHDDSTLAAWYSPVDKALHFSSSSPCRPDRGQDGMCMVHEYGHAIQDNQVPGWGGMNPGTGRFETGAMGEGFGDTLACTYFAPDFSYQKEIFEDWIFADDPSHGLRRVDGTKVYPTDWAGEVHDDGEIWSSALWNIYRSIGGDSMSLADRHGARDALLKTVINSHHLVATNGTMPDGAEAVMNTHAESDEYRGKYLMQMLDSFHARHLLLCSSSADLWMRDDVSDPGADHFVGPTFWDSPDLWIRNSDDNGTTHQDVISGQDNYFYCRVRNRGTVTARAFVVTFNVKPWAGVEFTYPGDFIPFISAAVGFNLAAGASVVLKAKWPASLVPAAGVHACWLAQVYTPVDTTAAGRHVWESNNLAQKNLTIVPGAPDQDVTVHFQIGNLANPSAQQFRLEIRRPDAFPAMPVSIVHSDPKAVRALFNSPNEVKLPAAPTVTTTTNSTVRFLDPARVQIASGGTPVSMQVAADSVLHVGPAAVAAPVVRTAAAQSAGAKLVTKGTAAEIALDPGILAGFPVVLQARAQPEYGVKITVPKDAKAGDSFKVQVVQRNSQNVVVGGITVQVNVVKG